ncbi:MAG: hypothetical protein QM627_04635 [Luteolibacter sp.]
MNIVYHQVTSDEHEQLCNLFIEKNGDGPNGIIADEEFDQLFDLLAKSLAKYGTFSESCDDDVDFSGYRYVDQIPVIQTVVRIGLEPTIAIQAALEAVSTAHRPLGASFDFHPHYILVTPPNNVFSTYNPSEIKI